MAKVEKNIVIQGASGKLGDLIVFRQVRGKTIMTAKGQRTKKMSEKQKEVTQKFQRAVMYGKASIADESTKELYLSGVTSKKHNPYLVAVADFLNAPDFQSVDFTGYEGNVGDTIVIRVTDDFMVANVEVEISNPDGSIVESGNAIQSSIGLDWVYTATVQNDTIEGDKITISAYDLPNNKAVHDVEI